MFDFLPNPRGQKTYNFFNYNDKQFACYVVILTIYFNTSLEKYFDSTTEIEGVFKD